MVGLDQKLYIKDKTMKTKTNKVFKYNELSEKAKENAYSNWLESFDCEDSNSEYVKALKMFTHSFYCIKLVDWSVDTNDYTFRLHDTEQMYSNYFRQKDKMEMIEMLNDPNFLENFTGNHWFFNAMNEKKDKIISMDREEFYEFFFDIYREFFSGWSSDISNSFSIDNFEEFYAYHEYLENGEIA